MIRFLRSLFAWKVCGIKGCWQYSENTVTGQRAADQVSNRLYGPVDFDWLDAGCETWRPHPRINGRPAWRSAEGQISGRYC